MNGKDQMIFQYMVQEKRIFGATLDEVIPIIAFVILFFFIGYVYIGIGLSVVWFFYIRRKKKGMGTKYLLAVSYWYFPFRFKKGHIHKIPYLKTPPADRVHWI